EVVAVERDVDHAERHRRPALDLADLLPDTLRKMDAAGADPDQRQLVGSLVALEDLVRDARERTLDRERVHHLPGAVGAQLLRLSHLEAPELAPRNENASAALPGGVARSPQYDGRHADPFLTSPGQVKRGVGGDFEVLYLRVEH